MAMMAARPSLPSMKLNRFADQAMARVANPTSSNHHGAEVADVMGANRAIAATKAAKPWMASRGTGCTPRQSSTSDTTATDSHAAPHTVMEMAATGGDSSAAGMNPAQIARPPTRSTGRSWSDRSVRRAFGRRSAKRTRRATPQDAINSERRAADTGDRPKSATGRPGAPALPHLEVRANRAIPA